MTMTKTNPIAVAATILAVMALLVGCAADSKNNTMVVLQHPTTKETKECKGDAWANWNPYAATEACAAAYEKAGYVRMGAY